MFICVLEFVFPSLRYIYFKKFVCLRLCLPCVCLCLCLCLCVCVCSQAYELSLEKFLEGVE